MNGKICITLDVDWACGEIVEYSVELLKKYDVKATIFATHNLTFLKKLNEKQFEIGIHPNFINSNNYEKTIDDLLETYPNAIGVRSHAFVQSTHIFSLFIQKNLKYDSSTYIPLNGLNSWIRLKKLVCIPIYWSDDTMFYSGLPFNLSQLHLSTDGLKVYVFHPIHIFANTQSGEHYSKFKPFYHQPEELIKMKGRSDGVQTIFMKLLKHIQRSNIKSYTCKEIAGMK